MRRLQMNFDIRNLTIDSALLDAFVNYCGDYYEYFIDDILNSEDATNIALNANSRLPAQIGPEITAGEVKHRLNPDWEVYDDNDDPIEESEIQACVSIIFHDNPDNANQILIEPSHLPLDSHFSNFEKGSTLYDQRLDTFLKAEQLFFHENELTNLDELSAKTRFWVSKAFGSEFACRGSWSAYIYVKVQNQTKTMRLH